MPHDLLALPLIGTIRQSLRITGIGPVQSLGWMAVLTIGMVCAQPTAATAKSPAGTNDPPPAEVVRLTATADVWLADTTPRERNSSAGKAPQVKLKNVQELAIFRFDASRIVGREVLRAALHLRRCGPDSLRWIRVSTVNQDWREGGGRRPYGPPDGATFLLADAGPGTIRSWAWPGSSVADVIMTSGNSLDCWAEREELEGGWIRVAITPELVYALAVGDTDGLAVMDGGNPANQNNFLSSADALEGRPFLEVHLGKLLDQTPADPMVTAEPDPERAGPASGAIRVRIEPAPGVFCWRLRLDGRPVPRWHVKHPEPEGPTVFTIDEVQPDGEHELEVVAVGRSGRVSSPVHVRVSTCAMPMPNVALRPLEPAHAVAVQAPEAGGVRVWAVPGLVKIGPVAGEVINQDLGAPRGTDRPWAVANAVWDGRQVNLFGARGEYVSYQLCVENLRQAPGLPLRVWPQSLSGPQGGRIGPENVELAVNWYARNRRGQWQPAYCIPIEPGTPVTIPYADDRLPEQRLQSFYVDLYIPKDAKPGPYHGSIMVDAAPDAKIILPVRVDVLDFVLPDRLTFWPELNAFRIPRHAHDYYRLAHQHRCVLNCWAWRPGLVGSGREIQVVWDQYDRWAGPLLTGEAFARNRRSGVPVECMYLPFEDSWPTPLSKEAYRYEGPWPGRGGPLQAIIQHYVSARPIEQALTREYREAFLAVQRQFIEHFQQKGYTQTEMQCCFGGKATHRIDFGTNVWWTTDEPYYWDDWLALRFFLRLWTEGRGTADPRIWAARADISRPQWQGRVLDGVLDAGYYGAGGFSGPAQVRRTRTLARNNGTRLRVYGTASPDEASNLQTVATLLTVWAEGAQGFVPWQTLGPDEALDHGDLGAEAGNALLVPGDRFGLPVVADFRVKALRDGQQVIEYLEALATRHRLSRDQMKLALLEALGPQKLSLRAETAETPETNLSLTAWELCALRRRLAELLSQ